ncbi:MAG TPA: hypothetical protein VJ770_29480 [Stellaceae bacterium]|nr:hypothetical protein [Stellaceae bacterium]
MASGKVAVSAADPYASLRERLLAMRAEMVKRMVRDGFSSGIGRMLSELAAAIDALDAAGSPYARTPADGSIDAGQSVPPHQQPPERAGSGIRYRVVVAGDDSTIALTLYDGREVLGTIALDPVHVIGLGVELIRAGHIRLSRAQSGISLYEEEQT